MPRSVASTATLALVVVVFAIAPPPTAAHGSETNGVAPVLLISLDGFRASYLDAQPAAALPHLTSFWRGGVRAALTPRFVSKTFPNHYSIVTGTHERAHGIVANRFWDPYTQSWFTMDATASYWWDAAEPLWVTASRDARASKVYYWPGSEAEIRGRRPDVWKRFEHGVVPFEERVDDVARWLRDAHSGGVSSSGAFYTLVPIRPRSRGERRSLRTLPGVISPPTPRFQSPPSTPFNSN